MTTAVRFAAGAAFAAALAMALPAFAIEPGAPAPAFELYRLDGGSVRSRDLFSTYDETFLVFWWSTCPRCVEALAGCERFFRDYGGADLAVIGVSGDERILGARGAVEAGGITFPQARDENGATSASYGVPRETFTVVLVSSPGIVRAVRIDPTGDLRAAMEEMLAASAASAALAKEAAAGEAPAAGTETGSGSGGAAAAAAGGAAERNEGTAAGGAGAWSISGLQRIRLLGIDTGGSDEAVGLYGEPVHSMRAVQYRLEVEGSMRLVPHLRVGGLLRISNEGEDVLEAGPEYYGSEWGSAFAEFDASSFHARVGYFTLYMTPLTYMRWDWDDNPHIGGSTGCGCGGAAAGTLLVESLEELGPDLTVEGALASYDIAGVEAIAFYAMPRRALETSYAAFRYAGAERARYSQEIAGFELAWQRFDRRTGLFWKAGLHAITTFEDSRSADFIALGYSAAPPWTDTWTVSATAEAPLLRDLRLRGEILALNTTEEHGVLEGGTVSDVSTKGGGGFGGIVYEPSPRLVLAVDYLRLAPGYYAPFAALSYETNTEGVRVSGRAPLFGDLVSLSLFYKGLRDADLVFPGVERKETWIAGASVDLTLRGGVGGSLGWQEERSQRGGSVSPTDARRRSFVANVFRDFGRVGSLTLQYEGDRWEETAVETAAKSKADIYSLYSSIDF